MSVTTTTTTTTPTKKQKKSPSVYTCKQYQSSTFLHLSVTLVSFLSVLCLSNNKFQTYVRYPTLNFIISSIRHYLSIDVTRIIICLFVLSRLTEFTITVCLVFRLQGRPITVFLPFLSLCTDFRFQKELTTNSPATATLLTLAQVHSVSLTS